MIKINVNQKRTNKNQQHKKWVNNYVKKINQLAIQQKLKPYNQLYQPTNIAKNIRVLLCCIAKMENNYIKEFVEHYKKLGFDNICLYDNNDVNGEKFTSVINKYIKSGFVIVKNKRGVKNAQIKCYTECYQQYHKKYDWIAFFDIDEFLHIDNNLSIKQFLSQQKFNNNYVNCIRICWRQYTDSGLVKVNNKNYSINRFTHYLPINILDCTQTKIILKGNLNNIVFDSPHGCLKNKHIYCVNSCGVKCSNSINISNKTWSNACLNHYRFKTIEEYVLNKMVRLWPHNYKNFGKKILNLNFFFLYNKRTKEKENYAKQLLSKKL